MNDEQEHVMIGGAARHFGVPPWKVRRAIERGFYPEPPRMGPFRVIPRSELPVLELALRRAGYLPEPLTAA
jgi:hypothetical protein